MARARHRRAARRSTSSRGRAAPRTSSSRSRAAFTGPRKCTRSSWSSRSVAERYFSVADVEALIPELSRIMGRVMSAHVETSEAQQRMQAEQQRIALAGGGVLDRRAWRADTERVERLTTEIPQGLGKHVGLRRAPKELGPERD